MLIDQLRADQTDVYEKKHEVKLTGGISSKTHNVCVWARSILEVTET
jgi:hypothetical protein